MSTWQPIETAPEGVTVLTKIDDEFGVRNEQPLRRRGRLWFSNGMYIYYAPTHWMPYTDPPVSSPQTPEERT